MNKYSPFEKELRQLETNHLVALMQAAEGWYIEYKREVPNASSIAKSVSAFANTYGGWLFYGVQELSKEEPVAGSFPGVPRNEIDGALQRIRQAVATQATPSPHFDCRVLWGPCDAIKLTENQGIICVHVPWSASAPHVHKNGHIYRRVGDGSEPKAENDRFMLDQLWRRGDNLRKEYEQWIERDPDFSKGEGEHPYIRLLLVADLWRDRNLWIELPLGDVREMMGATHGLISGLPFDIVYTSAAGFIARQGQNNNPHDLGLTWRLRPNLASDVLLPLNFHAPDKVEEIQHFLEGYEGAGQFSQALKTHGHKTPRIVDLNVLFNVLLGVVEIQRRLLKRAEWTDGYFIKARLLNVWRTCPFLDVKAVLNGFDQYGVPMCLDKVVTSPPGSVPESFAVVPPFEDMEDERVQIYLQALLLFAPIARAFGLPVWLETSGELKELPYYLELQTAGQRAMQVQQIRNRKTRTQSF